MIDSNRFGIEGGCRTFGRYRKRKMERKLKVPPIGMRIIKSAVAILLCYIVSFLRGNSGIVFYSQLAALWCMQVYVANSKKNAVQRFIGTVIGALYGLLYLLIRKWTGSLTVMNEILDAVFISALVVIILYTTVLLHKKQASYFSCVVFLSIVVNHVSDVNPYLFVWNRFLDTVIGIVIGVGVNILSLPRDHRKDILFLSGLDDTLLGQKDNMSDYSRIELNRMLDDGMNFTISTMRTPASLIEPVRDIRLKLPVIAMDGAVLFDIYEKRYLKVYVISREKSMQVQALIRREGLSCFTNVIIDDMLVIYYNKSEDAVHKQLVRELRRSPYRNYVERAFPENEEAVYFMLLYPAEVIENFYQKLEEAGITKELKVLKYASEDYPGYAYIKIYNRNATKENMVEYLKKMTGLSHTVTFGTIPGRYDVVVERGDSNRVVHMLKKLYEPVKRRPGWK
ncbi:MAG: HAD hydrolase family protein [Lachnospiraceae bacterium]|nr:HAD hydrolase family protein [Lachnospiraceae bacterium]